MSDPAEVELDVEALLRTLRAHDVEFVVIGGLAVVAHGFLRGTKYLDIAPKPTTENRRPRDELDLQQLRVARGED